MRKTIIGLFVVAIFLVYSYVIRHNHSEPVIAPASISRSNTNNTNASSNSNTNSQTTTQSQTATTPTTTQTTSSYKDGSYTGSVDSAFYGNVQVEAIVQAGKISQVDVLQSPNENPNSIYVNSQALPYLKQETIKAQSAHIDSVSGATLTSQAFIQSLTDALKQAE